MEEEALRRAEEEREAARREEEERRAKKQAEIDRERARRNQVRNIPAPEEEDDDGELELESLDDMLDTNNLMDRGGDGRGRAFHGCQLLKGDPP